MRTIENLSRVPGGCPEVFAHDADPEWMTGAAPGVAEVSSPPGCGDSGSSGSASASSSATASARASVSASASVSSSAGASAEGNETPTPKSAYGLSEARLDSMSDMGIRYGDLAGGEMHAIQSHSSDGDIASGYCPSGDPDGACPADARLGFTVLEDPEHVVRGEHSFRPVPIAREGGRQERPDAAEVLDEASARLELEELLALNLAVYLDDTELEDAVAGWREGNGL